MNSCSLFTNLKEYCIDKGVTFIKTNQVELYGYKNKVCMIRQDEDNPVVEFISEIKALRAAIHDLNGVNIDPLLFTPDDAIILNRIYAADEAAFICRIAWESKLAGNNELYDYVAVSALSTILATMQIVAKADFRTLKNGDVMLTGFECFFLDATKTFYDRQITERMLADNDYCSQTVDPREDIKQVIIDICKIPLENGSYVELDIEEVLFGSPLFTQIIHKPIENFLWFIKFERSFSSRDASGILIKEESAIILKIPENTKKDLSPEGKLANFFVYGMPVN